MEYLKLNFFHTSPTSPCSMIISPWCRRTPNIASKISLRNTFEYTRYKRGSDRCVLCQVAVVLFCLSLVECSMYGTDVWEWEWSGRVGGADLWLSLQGYLCLCGLLLRWLFTIRYLKLVLRCNWSAYRIGSQRIGSQKKTFIESRAHPVRRTSVNTYCK